MKCTEQSTGLWVSWVFQACATATASPWLTLLYVVYRGQTTCVDEGGDSLVQTLCPVSLHRGTSGSPGSATGIWGGAVLCCVAGSLLPQDIEHPLLLRTNAPYPPGKFRND